MKAGASANKPTFSSEGFGGEGLSPTNVLFQAELCACPTPCGMVWPPELMAQGPEGRQAEKGGVCGEPGRPNFPWGSHSLLPILTAPILPLSLLAPGRAVS